MEQNLSSAGGLLIAVTITFSIPYLVWRLCRTDYFVPLVVLQIITGIMFGPGVMGKLFPEPYGAVFSPTVIQSINGIASWAVAVFVWLAGIELDLKQAWQHRRESVITAALALAVPFALGCATALGMLQTPGWIGSAAEGWQFVLGIGMACAVTALPILILLMEKLAIFREPIGQRLLRYASLDDIAIWSVLALILMDWQRIGMQAAFLAGFALAGAGVRRLMPRLAVQDRWYVGLIWLSSCSLAAEWSGLHFMVGAFLAGAVLDGAWFVTETTDQLRRNVLFVLMPVYFMSAGLKTDWGGGGALVFLAAGVLLVAAVAGKLFGVWIAGRILAWRPGEAALIGWLLQTKALIMIVFVSVLLDTGIIARPAFTALLLMAIASTVLTVPVVAPMLARMRGAT